MHRGRTANGERREERRAERRNGEGDVPPLFYFI